MLILGICSQHDELYTTRSVRKTRFANIDRRKINMKDKMCAKHEISEII